MSTSPRSSTPLLAPRLMPVHAASCTISSQLSPKNLQNSAQDITNPPMYLSDLAGVSAVKFRERLDTPGCHVASQVAHYSPMPSWMMPVSTGPLLCGGKGGLGK